jgi:hypothetical protein
MNKFDKPTCGKGMKKFFSKQNILEKFLLMERPPFLCYTTLSSQGYLSSAKRNNNSSKTLLTLFLQP